MNASDYRPPRWLHNAHVQSLLGSSPLRRQRAARAFASAGALTTMHLFDGGAGVRLQGFHSVKLDGGGPDSGRSGSGVASRGLVVLFHGWEGSAQSSYMHFTAACLLDAGFEVVRLNFRDHGDTHALNEEIFHSGRIAEVVNAVADIACRFPARPLQVAGYSLGGNFALRLALRAPAAGIPLRHVAAVCPVLDPAAGMDALERGRMPYHWYFQRKWRASLRRKRALFPALHDFDDATLAQPMRPLTRWLVERYTDYGTLENYFAQYGVPGDQLAALQVPASVLTAADDPVIPIATFRALRLPAHSRLEIAPHGGHCGFLEGLSLRGFGERWVTARMLDQIERAAPSDPAPHA